MNNKKVNWMFLSIIAFEAVVIFVLAMLQSRVATNLASSLVLSELILILPMLVFLIFTKTRIREVFDFRQIRLTTALATILFVYLTMPAVTTINAISMLFSDNVVADMSQDILSLPFIVMLILMGVFGPVCEELVFRGAVYSGYKNSGSAFKAMFFSAFLFALIHMNFNQAMYAFFIGIVLVLLKEASGSIWTSILYHVVFNSHTVILLYLYDKWLPDMGMSMQDVSMDTKTLLITMSVGIVLSVITLPIAACLLYWIAKNEKNEKTFIQMWKERTSDKRKLVSIPFVISTILCLAFMVYSLL